VVAVSNGAAAVKKIAEHKPDIIILDVYMPGYSGLEVCEKVRGSLETVKIPVLLTVGKLEPYKAEDGHRVKADGVIIKPFEATDLLAIVKKFEERIALLPPPPIAAPPPRPEPKYEEEEPAPEPAEHKAAGKSSVQPMVEVPDHMASSSAFSDLLGSDSTSTPQHFASTPAAAFETSVIVPVPPVISSEDEIPAAWHQEAEHITTVAVATEPEIVATPVTDAPEQVAEAPMEATVSTPEIEAPAIEEPEANVIQVEAVDAEPPHPQFIPVYKEPEPAAEPAQETASYEVMPTAVPPIGEIDIPKEPALQETAEETTRSTVADHVEPGLMSPMQQMETPAPEIAASANTSAASADFEVAPAVMEVSPVESAPAPPPAIEPPVSAPPIAVAAEVTDSDFEARVAAAMAAYSHAEAAQAPAPVATTPAPVATEAAPAANSYTAQAFEVAAAAEPVPSFEYHPAAPASAPEHAPAAQNASAPAEFIPEPAPVPSTEPVAAEPEVVHSTIAAGMEEAATTAAHESGADHHNIAQAIHRVMERLKPELVEEIMRELKPKK
jgi:CheY-like chemotaxis protein